MKSLMRNSALGDALVKNVYAEPALIPASPWLGSAHPEKPMLSVADAEGGKLRVSWSGGGTGKSHLWVLQTQSQEGEWKAEVLSAQHISRTLEGPAPNVIAISAVDRLGNAGPPVVVRMKHEIVASAPPPAQSSTQPPSVQPAKEPKIVKKKLVSPKAKS
jgi:hypothetical protein